jgi:hypothetical protein
MWVLRTIKPTEERVPNPNASIYIVQKGQLQQQEQQQNKDTCRLKALLRPTKISTDSERKKTSRTKAVMK